MGARSSKITAQNNRSDGHLLEYFRNTFIRGGGAAAPLPVTGLIATGGVISDYSDPGPGAVYRAHIFASSGTFDVTAPGVYGDTVEYLVVAGGGGGAGAGGGGGSGAGGGGGGLLVSAGSFGIPTSQNQGSSITIPGTFPAPFVVTIGAGGVGGGDGGGPPTGRGTQGGPSSFGPVSTTGGGYGGCGGGNNDPGGPGGSGGGAGSISGTVGAATNYPGPTQQGFPGGTGAGAPGAPGYGNGGGGGAGAVGGNGTTTVGGSGGNGLQVLIAEPPATPSPTRTIGADGGYFAGGGGSGIYQSNTPGSGGTGGGGDAGPGADPGESGKFSTGGGGGGASWPSSGPGNLGGSGGSGIVVVRYQIAQLTATAKATGGAISYYGGKTIHTFTSSGAFATAPNWTATNVEYVVVGGGGAGGGIVQGGGGGAGAYRTGTTPIGAHPVSTTIQVGGGANSNPTPATAGTGTPSYFGPPITAPGGGSGGTYPNGAAVAGGSGGGSGGAGTSPNAGGLAPGATSFPGTIGATPPSSWWGHIGGTGGSLTPPAYGPAGGGGAGGAGSNGDPSDTTAGRGGAGIQLPATFRNPLSTVGAPGPTSAPTPNGFDTSGKYWVAGGGGGTGYNPPGTAIGVNGAPGGAAPGSSSPYAGGGGGAGDNNGLGLSLGSPGTINTGGGGGGGERDSNPSGGNGGSGIVLIAYPS